MEPRANDGKQLTIQQDGRTYQRIPVQTALVLHGDNLDEIVAGAVSDVLQPGDIVFVTEKIVAICQGRSFPLDEIAPRKLATFLSKRVVKTPHGIGLGIPETMEMALRECGMLRILLAAAVSAVTKKFGRSGDFYRVAGERARGIDGPTAGTLPPYDSQVVLVPNKPNAVAARLSALIGADVAIVDINDLGGNILGSTLGRKRDEQLVRILSDNPLGQGAQRTPIGIIRAV